MNTTNSKYNKFVLFGFVVLIMIGCIPTLSVLNYATESDVEQLYSGIYKQKTCRENTGYMPDSLYPLEQPIRYVKCVVHFMNSKNENHNYKEEKAIDFSLQLIKDCNQKWDENPSMFLPKNNELPALTKQVRLELQKDLLYKGDNGVYYHRDDELYYFVHKGKDRNSGSRKVIKKYAVRPDSILNIFILAHHPDSILSTTYKARRQGITLGKHIKIAGQWVNKRSAWEMVNLTNHEIGHVFGLSHTWSYNDGCDDTPKNPNCWNFTKDGPCVDQVSNNMMDYNAYQIALSPCQIARMHKNFSRIGSRQRKLLKVDWCSLDSTKDIRISSKRHWTGAKDLKNNIIIEPGGILKISCRLSLPENGKILVKAGGVLILENAILHNDCDQQWKGIQIETIGQSKGRVVLLENVEINNVLFPLVSN